MTPILSADENSTILQTLLKGGYRARQSASESFEVFEKGIEDYVTTVDQSLDRYFAQAFTQLFPNDGVITEENQASTTEFLANYGRLWLIDPIDGTEDFIHRGQSYAVMVGLLIDERPRAGWIYAPAHQHLYWGGIDWGLFQQSDRGKPSPLEPCPLALDTNSVLLIGDRDRRRFGAAIAEYLPEFTFDAIGSFGLKVLEVIKGQAGLYVYLNGRVKLWDTTGPLALATAAGLVCCDLEGNPIRFDTLSIYPQTLIHRQPILIGWPNYVDKFRPLLRRAFINVRCQELELGS